jgi:hypothetical protein
MLQKLFNDVFPIAGTMIAGLLSPGNHVPLPLNLKCQSANRVLLVITEIFQTLLIDFFSFRGRFAVVNDVSISHPILFLKNSIHDSSDIRSI